MIRKKSNIFSVYQGITRKRTENFCNNALRTLMQYSVLFFWLRPQSTEKKILDLFLKSPLTVKGCKIWAHPRRLLSLSRERSLSCHTRCNKGTRFTILTEGSPRLVASYDSTTINESTFWELELDKYSIQKTITRNVQNSFKKQLTVRKIT